MTAPAVGTDDTDTVAGPTYALGGIDVTLGMVSGAPVSMLANLLSLCASAVTVNDRFGPVPSSSTERTRKF